MLKYLIPLVVLFGLIILFIFGLQNDPRIVPSPFIDKPLPDIRAPLLSQPDITFAVSELKGEVTLLNVWATWCIPCRQEHPFLVDLADHYDVKIVGLNYKDERKDSIEWLEKLGNPYDIILFDESGDAGIDLGVYGFPETFIMDHEHIVKYKHIGAIDEEVLNNTIIPLILELQQARVNRDQRPN